MARTEIPLVILDPTNGNPVANASVTVSIRGGAEATVYAAETGGTAITQPLISDSRGHVNGWIERGAYQAAISPPGFPQYTEPFESTPGADGSIDAAWLASGVGGSVLVFNVKDYGAVGDGVANDRPAIQAAIDAAAGRGTIFFPAGVYLLASVGPLLLPRNATSLRLVGAGATIKLTATCHTAFLFERVADYDNFQNVTIEDFIIDRDNVTVAGLTYTVLSSTGSQRVNWRNIAIRRVRVINAPASTADPSQAPQPNHDLRHIYLYCTHPTANEATQTVTENIEIENVELNGGNYGVGILAQGGGAIDVNHRHDHIRLKRVRHDTLANFAGVPLVYSANFHIGSRGHGERVELIDCHGSRSGDVGFEVNGIASLTLERCTSTDAAQVGFLVRNYNVTWADANRERQYATLRKCRGDRDVLVPTQAQAANNAMEGFYFGGASDLGHVDLVDCSVRVRRQDAVGAIGRAIVGGAKFFNITRFKALYETVNSAPTANTTPSFPFAITMPAAGRSVLRARDVEAKVAAIHTGANQFAPRCFHLSSGADVWVDIDGLEIDCVITGAVGVANAISLSPTTLNGTARGLKIVAMSDAASNLGLSVTPTNCTRLDVSESDFNGTGIASAFEWFVTTGLRPNVSFYAVRRVTHPRPTTAITVGASPFVHQNTTGQAQQVLVSGGTVSLIEYSINGTSWLATGETSGAFVVSNGEYLRVTHTAAPSMNASYLR